MSGDGGDTGGAGKGAGDTGGFTGDTASYGGGGGAGGSSNPGFGSGASSDFVVSGPAGGGYSDPTAGTGGGSGVSDPFGPSSLGGGGATSGTDFLANGGSPDGLNLAGSGPVGGIAQPQAAGALLSDTSAAGGAPLTADNNILGTTVPSNGAGATASAFAAPEGVSGSPQLSDWVTNPTGTTPTPAGQDAGIFGSLNAAETGAANDYANTRALTVPADSAGSSILNPGTPATTSSTGSTATGGGGTSSADAAKGSGLGMNMNTAGLALAGAGLLNNLINGNKSVPAVGQLQNTANTATATSNDLLARGTQQGQQFGTPALQSGQDQVAKGTALQDYVATGQLPQGYEDQITQGVNAAKQTIISNYAQRGLSTDPTKNSSLAQELSQVDARVPAAREQLAAQLATTGNSIVGSGNATSATGNALTGNQLLTDGLSAAGISSGVYSTLANLENDQNKQRATAIANFASALNGGNKGLTVNLGKAA